MAPKPENEPIQLTQQLVDDFAQLNAQCLAFKKDRDATRDQIIAALKAGQLCPDDGPFILDVSYVGQAATSWKEICMAIIESLPERLQEKAQQRMDAMLAERVTVPHLNVRVNPAWRAE